jgi:hypothetical protein
VAEKNLFTVIHNSCILINYGFFRRVRHHEIHAFSLANTRKYQEIQKKSISGNTCKFKENTRKYQEISGNSTKYQEIKDQKHEKLGNTLVFLRDSCSTWVFLVTELFYSFYWDK